MSAWSRNLEAAPRDEQILVRHEEWQCPAVVAWNDVYNEWCFAEEALQEMDGSLISLDGFEWALLPA